MELVFPAQRLNYRRDPACYKIAGREKLLGILFGVLARTLVPHLRKFPDPMIFPIRIGIPTQIILMIESGKTGKGEKILEWILDSRLGFAYLRNAYYVAYLSSI